MTVMIYRDEIEAKSREFEISVANVERDYVFGWILYGIFTVSDLRDSIFLKGGNALRKGYFENTRFSSDLDFGIPGDVDQGVLLAEINKVCDFIQEKAGVVFLKSDNKIEEKFSASEAPIPGLRVYDMRIYFNDFYGKRDDLRIKISLDITRFDKVMLRIQSVPIIHPYSDAAQVSCQIRCMKLEEIIAVKLKCLLQRQHAPDLFDYAYSIKLLGGTLNREEVVRTLIAKTIFGRNPHVLKGILQKTPFNHFKECWEKCVVCAKAVVIGAEEAISSFLADLDSLFDSYPDNGFSDFAFFTPEIRMPIMKAGREQTLLKIRYNGAERIVEPYSLKYLEKRDGGAKEYLYVFNRSGGNNPPGVRSLVPGGFQSIENTEEKFTPRFPIELSKAGELPENKYLFDPNKPTRPPTRRGFQSHSRTGPYYIYRCNICGKQFRRLEMDGSLNPHKNKSGYACYGTYGLYVTTKWH